MCRLRLDPRCTMVTLCILNIKKMYIFMTKVSSGDIPSISIMDVSPVMTTSHSDRKTINVF